MFGQDGWILAKFFICVFMAWDAVEVHKLARKERGQYPAILTEQKKKWSLGARAEGAYPGFCSMKRLRVFVLPLDGMLVHRRSLPRNLLGFPQQFTGTHLYSWVERGT